MLFNSYIFLFVFLPLVLLVFALLGRQGAKRASVAWIILASLCFYAFFGALYLFVIIGSILFNYFSGTGLIRLRRKGAPQRRQTLLLSLAVAANLAMLGYFKYANFFIDNVNALFAASLPRLDVILPLGISFFTFQQIIFLKDARQGAIEELSFSHYCFCVTFFPHLVAGPIIKYKNLLSQLARRSFLRVSGPYAAAGLAFFIIGLCKKLLLADNAARFADPVFLSAAQGAVPGFFQGWIAALAYSFQLYFDFSGYSDMAIGLALLFTIELPVNFNSPYKATGFIDFWRRWHITLSQFLRDCLYIPLGGSRRGTARKNLNLLITMLLGGLWHGAGWNFVLWGGLHGVFLAVNHAFRSWRKNAPPAGGSSRPGLVLSRSATFICVVLLWVLFRAQDLHGAGAMYAGMLGLAGPGAAPAVEGPLLLAGLACIAFFMPNAQEIMSRFKPCVERYLDEAEAARAARGPRWAMTPAWGIVMALVSFYLVLSLSNNAYFLYFQF